MWLVYCFQAAFRGNTLGLPKVCPPENVTKVERSHILTFLDQYHTLDRIVLAGGSLTSLHCVSHSCHEISNK